MHIKIELNMPPFMEGRKQLPASKVQKGQTIASQRINVERAIGRMKNLSIFKGTIPTSMARLANQIVCVCVCFFVQLPASSCSTITIYLRATGILICNHLLRRPL